MKTLYLIWAGVVCALRAYAQPVNDNFINSISLAGTNVVVTSSNAGATKETGEPYHAGYAGGASVWWSWIAPSAGTATISTLGSTFDTLLGVYTGPSVDSLVDSPQLIDGINTVQIPAFDEVRFFRLRMEN